MTSRQAELRQTPKGSLFRVGSEHEAPQHESRRTTPTPANVGPRNHASGDNILPGTGSDAFVGGLSRDPSVPSRTLQYQYDELATPSSTVAEFGDKAARSIVPSATTLVNHIHRSWTDSREGSRSTSISKSRSRSSSHREPREHRRGRGERRERSRDRSIASILSTAEDERSNTSTQKQQRHGSSRGPAGKSRPGEAMPTDEKVNRFLKSMRHHQSPSPPQSTQLGQTPGLGKPSEIDSVGNLTAENKSLYQRVAALQLTERELLAENQKLIRQVAALNHQLGVALEELEASKHQQEVYNHYWRKLFTESEDKYETRIHELGAQVVELSSTHPNIKQFKSLVSNDEIATWFTDQDAAWRAWARAYGHQDPNRLVAGLHPAQLQEICAESRSFVQLTNVEKLPVAILHGGKEAAHTLLQAMLANFFCAEILGSPYWVFAATSLDTLESPVLSLHPKALGSGRTGSRVDTNVFGGGGNDIAGTRGNTSYPIQNRHDLVPPLMISTKSPPGAGSVSILGLPQKSDMERLQFLLQDAQDPSLHGQHVHWRAHMMRLFATGGMALSPSSSSSAYPVLSSRQVLVESRLNYARKLRDRFLGSAARFLLNDQDALGIERLERVLTEMIDDALRFSCKLWSQPGGVRIRGWRDLSEFKNGYKKGMKAVNICQAQDKSYTGSKEAMTGSGPENDGEKTDENEGRPVIMLVQPAVEAVLDVDHHAAPSPVWLKARVMVAAPVEDPVPGSGASDAGFAPSPVNVRCELKEPSCIEALIKV
ncbi:hypothetical protein QBC41DRAFT_243451 [Cercophora samala]|uniref:Uncharacterized protein n=1 Tax=Cercophora samala TaxID=330535 RepID=A0AA40DET9_9PEZI|nr:hypothetical protein QBC41DRAFT_243451 [Cercophora samala]